MSTDLTIADRSRLRRLQTVWEGTQALRSVDPYAAARLDPIPQVIEELRSQAHVALIETLGDRPTSILRDEAARRLRETIATSLRQVRIITERKCTNELGQVTDVDAMRRLEAFLAGFVSGEKASNIAEGGPHLIEQGHFVIAGLQTILGADHVVTRHCKQTLDEVILTAAAVQQESARLADARARLVTVRETADQTLRIARATLDLMRLLYPELNLDPRQLLADPFAPAVKGEPAAPAAPPAGATPPAASAAPPTPAAPASTMTLAPAQAPAPTTATGTVPTAPPTTADSAKQLAA